MANWDTDSSLSYHQATKLSYINLAQKPPLYKSYPGAPVIPLPTDFDFPKASALETLGTARQGAGTQVDLSTLARLLYLSSGVIRKALVLQAGEVHYRAAASAGALYPIEAYLVCRDLPGLDAGVYHFAPADFCLRQLRQGDSRPLLAGAAAGSREISRAPAIIVFTSIFERSSWKYRARGYRYCLWDNGTVAASLLAAAAAEGVAASVVNAFVDQQVDHLVGVDGRREASICLVSLGQDGSPAVPADPGELLTEPILSESQDGDTHISVEYPEIYQMHASTALTTPDEAAACRGPLERKAAPPHGKVYDLAVPSEVQVGAPSLAEVIKSRGSTRRFDPSSISRDQFNAIVRGCAQPVPADFLEGGGSSLLELYLIINSVTGLPSGAYSLSWEDLSLALLEQGDFRQEAGHLCFEQALGADASAVAFFLADLEQVLGRYGNRGYRAAQLEAGIRGGRIYLAAHALGLGATGITFYDDDVTEFFSPHAAGKSVVFVVPFGRPGKPNRVKPFRSAVAVRLDALARGASPPQK